MQQIIDKSCAIFIQTAIDFNYLLYYQWALCRCDDSSDVFLRKPNVEHRHPQLITTNESEPRIGREK